MVGEIALDADFPSFSLFRELARDLLERGKALETDGEAGRAAYADVVRDVCVLVVEDSLSKSVDVGEIVGRGLEEEFRFGESVLVESAVVEDPDDLISHFLVVEVAAPDLLC